MGVSDNSPGLQGGIAGREKLRSIEKYWENVQGVVRESCKEVLEGMGVSGIITSPGRWS